MVGWRNVNFCLSQTGKAQSTFKGFCNRLVHIRLSFDEGDAQPIRHQARATQPDRRNARMLVVSTFKKQFIDGMRGKR